MLAGHLARSLASPLARQLVAQQSGRPFDWDILRDGMTPRRGSVAFTRASSGTYQTTQGGSILLAAINTARIEWDGLLIEPARTNLLLNSADLSTGWSAFSGASIGTTIPGAYTNISEATFGASDASSAIYQNRSLSPASYCFSVFAYLGVFRMSATVLTEPQPTWSNDITAGVMGDFYSYLFTAATNVANVALRNRVARSGSVKVGALQLEVGSYRTSYIPTTGSTAARSADVCTLTIPAGVSSIGITYGDNTTATVSVTPGGSYQLPANTKKYKSIIAL